MLTRSHPPAQQPPEADHPPRAAEKPNRSARLTDDHAMIPHATNPADRRAHSRSAVALGCKVVARSASRYLTARTTDVSAGGALVEIETTRPLEPGERLDIGVCWSGSGILRTRDLVEATVVRTTPGIGDRQRVAVAFEVPQINAKRIPTAHAA